MSIPGQTHRKNRRASHLRKKAVRFKRENMAGGRSFAVPGADRFTSIGIVAFTLTVRQAIPILSAEMLILFAAIDK
jgi:hypothetical protein